MTAETPAMPELRLSPDGTKIAHHWNPESPWAWTWVTITGSVRPGAFRADDVAGWTPLVPAPATVDRDAAVLAELRRMFDDAFPDEDSDYHYGSERLVDLVRDRIEKLEAAQPAPAPVSEDQELRAEDWQVLGEAARAATQPPAEDQEQRAVELARTVGEAIADGYYLRHPHEMQGPPAIWMSTDWQVLARAAITAMQPVDGEELVERLTVVLHDRQCGCPDWGPFGKEHAHYRDLARAVATALQEVHRG